MIQAIGLKVGRLLKILPLLGVFTLVIVQSVSGSVVACTPNDNSILGIPTWYKYLEGEEVVQEDDSVVCQPSIGLKSGDDKLPKTDILLIGAAILEILIRIAGLAAFIYLLYGGFMYLTSSGNSESVKKAGSTLLNAAIGLAIAISATTIINFFANKLTG